MRKEVLQVAVVATARLIAALSLKDVAQRDQAWARDEFVLDDFLCNFMSFFLGMEVQNRASTLMF